jgi:hypothetical protein
MSDLTEDELRALMKADLYLKTRQAAWEVPKAVAGILLACAVFMGFVLAASTWLHPSPQSITATVHLDQPLVVKVAP